MLMPSTSTVRSAIHRHVRDPSIGVEGQALQSLALLQDDAEGSVGPARSGTNMYVSIYVSQHASPVAAPFPSRHPEPPGEGSPMLMPSTSTVRSAIHRHVRDPSIGVEGRRFAHGGSLRVTCKDRVWRQPPTQGHKPATGSLQRRKLPAGLSYGARGARGMRGDYAVPSAASPASVAISASAAAPSPLTSPRASSSPGNCFTCSVGTSLPVPAATGDASWM